MAETSYGFGRYFGVEDQGNDTIPFSSTGTTTFRFFQECQHLLSKGVDRHLAPNRLEGAT